MKVCLHIFKITTFLGTSISNLIYTGNQFSGLFHTFNIIISTIGLYLLDACNLDSTIFFYLDALCQLYMYIYEFGGTYISECIM